MARKITITGFLILTVLLSSGSIDAQTLIPQLGVTFSKSSLGSKDTSPHDTEVDFRTGFLAGIGIEFPSKQKFKIQSGLFYIQKGGKSNHFGSSGSQTAIHRYDFLMEYIDVPVHGKIPFLTTLHNEFYFKLGPNLSYWVNGKCKYFFQYDDSSGGTPIQESGNSDIEYSEAYSGGTMGDTYYINRRFDIGIHAGLGVLVKKRIVIDLGYTFGLTEVEYFFETLAANRVVQLSVGMPFRINNSHGDSMN